jgi:hypothetical protein
MARVMSADQGGVGSTRDHLINNGPVTKFKQNGDILLFSVSGTSSVSLL